MLLNGRTPIKFDKIYVKNLGNLIDLSILNPGDTIKCSFLLKKWSWRNRLNTVEGRKKKLSELLMGKDKLSVDIAFYLQYKIGGTDGDSESNKTNKVSVVRSNVKSVLTQDIDSKHILDMVVPEYDNNDNNILNFFGNGNNRISKISSYLLISLDSRLIEDEVDICDINIEPKEVKFGYDKYGSGLYEYESFSSSYVYSNIINFFQTINRTSGYGIMGDGIVREINNSGFGWQIRDFCKDGRIRVNDNETVGLKSKIALMLNTPTFWFKARNSKYTIGYSMFECNRIPPTWINGCNRVNRIFVPVINNIEGFRLSGVNKDIPIDVVPIGIDANIYDPSKYVDNESIFDFGSKIESKIESKIGKDIYKFLVINDNQSRKNNTLLIKAIGEEFEEEISKNKVVLITRFCYGKKLIWDKFVYHIMKYLKDEDMVKLINSCDCMINVSSGECGDIPILQGMAMEKPVIISEDELIHSEVMEEGEKMLGKVGLNDRGVAFPVKIDRWEKAYFTADKSFNFGGLDGIWVLPDYYDLRKKLRYVYDNRNEEKIIEVGKNARKYIIEKRTVKVAVKRMTDIFNSLE